MPSGSPSQKTTGILTPESESSHESLLPSIFATFSDLHIKPDPSLAQQSLTNSSLNLSQLPATDVVSNAIPHRRPSSGHEFRVSTDKQQHSPRRDDCQSHIGNCPCEICSLRSYSPATVSSRVCLHSHTEAGRAVTPSHKLPTMSKVFIKEEESTSAGDEHQDFAEPDSKILSQQPLRKLREDRWPSMAL